MSWLPRPRPRSWVWATEVNRFTVVYDACVLYVDHTAVPRNRPDLSRQQLERTRLLMNENARDALGAGYQPLIAALELPDPDDRHVLAAAIKCGADLILTFNLDDVPIRFWWIN